MKPRDNPHGVGYSGNDFITRSNTCACCAFTFEYETPRNQPQRHTTCDDCTHHNLTGTETEHIDALYDHLEKYRQQNLQWQEHANNLDQELQQAEVKRERAQTAINYFKEETDTALAKLETIGKMHTQKGGECRCGQNWPCQTIKIIDSTQRR